MRERPALQRNALRVQHARDVMVGDDEEVGGRAEGCVGVGEETRVNVTMRGDDGQRRDGLIEFAGDGCAWRGRERRNGRDSSACQPAAIHGDDRAVHVIGCGGGEEYDCAFEVVGRAPACGGDAVENGRGAIWVGA